MTRMTVGPDWARAIRLGSPGAPRIWVSRAERARRRSSSLLKVPRRTPSSSIPTRSVVAAMPRSASSSIRSMASISAALKPRTIAPTSVSANCLILPQRPSFVRSVIRSIKLLSHQPSAISHQHPAIRYPLSAIRHAIGSSPSLVTVHCSPFTLFPLTAYRLPQPHPPSRQPFPRERQDTEAEEPEPAAHRDSRIGRGRGGLVGCEGASPRQQLPGELFHRQGPLPPAAQAIAPDPRRQQQLGPPGAIEHQGIPAGAVTAGELDRHRLHRAAANPLEAGRPALLHHV